MGALILGTRGSALALAQVELVKAALGAARPGIEIEVKIITTSGDARPETGAGEGSPAGLKGLFTKELQEALLAGSIDAAVHSVKDLPGITPAELGLAAVLPRAGTGDLLVSRGPKGPAGLESLPHGARIGTGSVRRRRQLLALKPGVEVVPLRGNVPTRLLKLAGLDAIVLARAGLDRLGCTFADGLLAGPAGFYPAAPLPILPAIGQGAIGLETRLDDGRTRALLAAIDHGPSHACIRVERALLRLLEGDCSLPVAALATIHEGRIEARAILFPPDEAAPPRNAAASGPAEADPAFIAAELHRQLAGVPHSS